jgi:hypothetical protein
MEVIQQTDEEDRRRHVQRKIHEAADLAAMQLAAANAVLVKAGFAQNDSAMLGPMLRTIAANMLSER